MEKLLSKLQKNNRNLPKYLLLENVLNLVQKQHIDDFNKWLNKLKAFGYTTIWGVIDSSKFGMIQKRRRVYALSYFVGKGKEKIIKNFEDELLKIIEQKIYKPINIQKSIKKVMDFENKNEFESKWSQIKETSSRLRMVEKGHITIDKKTLPTVTTKQDRLPNVGYVTYNNKREDKLGTPYLNKRFISPREAYLLMGFRDVDYNKAKIKMLEISNVSGRTNSFAREKLYKQAGNSIVINVLEMIFYYIIGGLKN